MLYDVLTRMIERGDTVDLQEKLDIFYAAARLTKKEYNALIKLLGE